MTYISEQRLGATWGGGKADEFGRVCGCNHRGAPHSWYRVNERETPGPGTEREAWLGRDFREHGTKTQ